MSKMLLFIKKGKKKRTRQNRRFIFKAEQFCFQEGDNLINAPPSPENFCKIEN